MARIDRSKRTPIKAQDVQIGQIIWYHSNDDYLVEITGKDANDYLHCGRYLNSNSVSTSGGGCGGRMNSFTLPTAQEIDWFHECMRQKKLIDINTIVPQVNNHYEIF